MRFQPWGRKKLTAQAVQPLRGLGGLVLLCHNPAEHLPVAYFLSAANT